MCHDIYRCRPEPARSQRLGSSSKPCCLKGHVQVVCKHKDGDGSCALELTRFFFVTLCIKALLIIVLWF